MLALVLGCDLTPDGLKLGPKTISRLQTALQHAKITGHQLVVAAGKSPRHPKQPPTMADMMAAFLTEHGYTDTVVRQAVRFNTRGEIEVVPDLSAVISDPRHLKRVRILLKKMFGHEKAESIEYIPTSSTSMTLKGRLLEPLKCAFLYLPFRFQDWAISILHSTPLRWINLSH